MKKGIDKDLLQDQYYVNRELSWIQFNERVLSEARDKNIPLFTRLKFLSITASNLDEFFMVRVASLKDMVHAGYKKRDIAGMTASEQLLAISEKLHAFTKTQYTTWNRSLLPLLEDEGITIVSEKSPMTKEEAEYADRYFRDRVFPVLTPMAVDSSRPFPLIRNKSLNIAALLRRKEKGKKETEFATVQMPSGLDRMILLPAKKGLRILLLEDLIQRHLQDLFLNYEVLSSGFYRIERNAELTMDEEEAADLLKEIEKQLKKRQWGEVIKLDVREGMDSRLLKILKKEWQVEDTDLYVSNGPLDLTFLMKLHNTEGYDHLRIPSYCPAQSPSFPQGCSIFEEVRKGDILLHHPYESFDPVVAFVREAARDPKVLAIKQTLYRVSGRSPIIEALSHAAENGKQVSVLVELKARFDEENNIAWAKRLEKSGCHVIYGLKGLKTHSKITLVVRDEEDGIRRYVHLGTGNYNDSTAKLYTDFGLFTCRREIGEDATAVFNMISGYSEPGYWNRLVIAPIWLRDHFLQLIDRETNHAAEGKPAAIIAKMNSLCDKEIISHLYQASRVGVKVQLIVRGICCLKTGIPGVSENIEVRSIVGEFLEHSRVFYFLNNGDEEVYMASADWMPRNLDKRLEILFPIQEKSLRKRAIDFLNLELQDTMKAHCLTAEGVYEKVDLRGKSKINSQEVLCKEAHRMEKEETEKRLRTFEPLEAPEEGI